MVKLTAATAASFNICLCVFIFFRAPWFSYKKRPALEGSDLFSPLAPKTTLIGAQPPHVSARTR
jgi:hypothetical protein